MLLYTIAKIAFITARIIAFFDFISAGSIYDSFHIFISFTTKYLKRNVRL